MTDTSSSSVKTIGYIGLGNAGFSLASNLPRAGYNLVVHDADDTKVQRAVSEWKNTKAAFRGFGVNGDGGGVRSDDSGKGEGFADCEILVTMLPQGKIVREVLFGDLAIAKSLKPGTIIIDTSSSSPFDTRALGEELAQHSLQLVDSPITQTYMHATDAGEATMMVGSDSPETYEKVKPVLQQMARYIFHMGRLGAGHAMKTLNNYIMASGLIALNDSLVTGQKFGLDPQTMIEVLNVGTGVTFSTLDTYRRDALTRNFNSGFGLALLVKDLGITKDFMQHNKFETDLPDMVQRYLQYSLDQVDPRADHTEALRGWEKRSGVELTKTEKVKDIPKEDFEHRLKGLNRS